MTDPTSTIKAKLPSDLPGSDLMAPIIDAADEAVTVAKENAGLIIVGGIALGLFAAALMPRSKKKKLAKRSKKIAALASEITSALASQASDAAGEGRDRVVDLSKSIGDSVAENSAAAKKQAGKLASTAADQLNDSGKAIARTLVKLIEKARS